MPSAREPLSSLLDEVDDDAPRVLSVCSGVGGKDLGFHRGGFRTVGLCEWDEWRRSVLARHWPGVPIHPDITGLADWAERAPDEVREWCGGQPHVLIGGTPCQDLSSAGKRAGLGGERSGLFFAFMRLRHALGIEWTVWENVRGALTSNGGLDFMEVLGTFVGAAVPLPAAGVGGAGVAAGPRGGVVWRLLNAQHFGVPQRRRRVFVVGRLGGECSPEVLLESASGGRNSAEGGASGARPPWAAALRVGRAGGTGLEGAAGRGPDAGRAGGDEPVGRRRGGAVQSLTTRFGNTGTDLPDAEAGWLVGEGERSGPLGGGPHGWRNDLDGHGAYVAGTVTRRYGKGPDSDGGYGQLVAPTLAKQGVGTGQFLGSDAGVIAAGLTGGGHPGSNPPGRRREDDTNSVAAGDGVSRGERVGPAGERHDGSDDSLGAGRGERASAAAGGAADGVPAGGGEPGHSEGRRVESSPGEGGSAQDDVGGRVAPVDSDGVRAADGVAGRVDGDVIGVRDDGVAHALTKKESVTEDGMGRGTPIVAAGGAVSPCGCPWDYVDAGGFCACCGAHLDDPRGLYAWQGGPCAEHGGPEPMGFRDDSRDTPREDGQAPTLAGGGKNVTMVATFVKRHSAASATDGESWGESDVARTVSASNAHRQDSSPALVTGTLRAAMPTGGSAGDDANALAVGRATIPISSDAAAGRSGVAAPGGDVGSCSVDPLPDGRRYAACGDGVAAPQAHWIALRLRAVMEGRDPDVVVFVEVEPAAGARRSAQAMALRGREGGNMPELSEQMPSLRSSSGGSSRAFVLEGDEELPPDVREAMGKRNSDGT